MNYNYTKKWDIAMAEPIIKAMRGFITTWMTIISLTIEKMNKD